MNKLLVRLLLVLAGFAGLTIPVKAQVVDQKTVDQIAVKIPFEFVAAGQTLPAGEYRISRLSDQQPRIMLLTNRENRGASIMLRPVTEATPQGKANLGFTTVGDQHFLSRIETGDYAYILAVPSAESVLAAAASKARAASSASGSN